MAVLLFCLAWFLFCCGCVCSVSKKELLSLTQMQIEIKCYLNCNSIKMRSPNQKRTKCVVFPPLICVEIISGGGCGKMVVRFFSWLYHFLKPPWTYLPNQCRVHTSIFLFQFSLLFWKVLEFHMDLLTFVLKCSKHC